FGQAVTFTATLSALAPGAGTPDGSIQFKDGGLNLGAAKPLSGGAATLTVSSLGGGDHNITAVFAGDDNFNGSSGGLTQTVTCDRVVTGTQHSTTASSS